MVEGFAADDVQLAIADARDAHRDQCQRSACGQFLALEERFLRVPIRALGQPVLPIEKPRRPLRRRDDAAGGGDQFQEIQVVGRGQRLRGIHINGGICIRPAEGDHHVARAIGVCDILDAIRNLALAAKIFLAELRGQCGNMLLVELLEGAARGGGDDGAYERHGDDRGECEGDQQARAEGHGGVPESHTFSKRQSPRRVTAGGANTRTRLDAA